jgi:pyochelin synthetase
VTTAELIAELEGQGVRIWAEDGSLRYRAPKGVMTQDRLEALREHKEALLEQVSNGSGAAAFAADPEARFEPFPLTDVQSAYLLGRRDVFSYGGVACHGYGELAFDDLDLARMETAWQGLVDRHDMLRATIEPDGSQRVLAEPPPIRIPVVDVRGEPPERAAAAVAATRAEMDHRVYEPGSWPLFDVRATLTDERALLHVSIDFLIADFVSIQVLLDELHRRYLEPERSWPELELTFRDYVLAERRLRSGSRYERDREYWLRRLDELPPPPELPLLGPAAAEAAPRFRRSATTLDREEWRALKQAARARGVTASTAVLAAYAEVVAHWSRQRRFTLDLTLLNRLPLHPQVGELIGDFTSIELLAVGHDPHVSFARRAMALQAQLWQDLDHRLYSGIEVIRELGRSGGHESALFPIVFTSAVGLDGDADADDGTGLGELVYGISQTPQVWIDCQVTERGGALSLNWDVREGVFPDGLVDDMFAAFEDLLRRLAIGDDAWDAAASVPLPAAQAERRRRVNDTAAPLPDGLLHEGLVGQALREPDHVAVVADGRTLSYGELLGRALAVAERLREEGCEPHELVAVVMDKGWEQVVAVLGTLLAGGVYVPVDTNQPPARRERMLADAGVRVALTQSRHAQDPDWQESVTRIAVDRLDPSELPEEPPARLAEPDDLAYVIYTSGSTGVPKGVMVSHRSALNTIADLNGRFAIGPDDRILGLASLGFDLSVYDVFGPLAAGGSLVLPSAVRRGDPSHWAELVAEHGVTLWNSVPAQMQMLHDYLATEPWLELPSLRLAFLSGDWIPVGLPDQVRRRLPGLELVSMGGATEAAIWSIIHPIREVDPEWRSIPYGVPLANQTFHVLDDALRPRPDLVPGELYIGGAGLALGYHDDPEKTAERFVRHPETGERLYRTGDLGRYLGNGEIEFLGREDFQVKIRGHRIELAEVEAALSSYPVVGAAAALVEGDEPLERRLVAVVEPAYRSDPLPSGRIGAGLDRETRAGADAVLASLDGDRYLAYTRSLDEVALLEMLHALRTLGLFGSAGESHTLEEILEPIAPRHHRLIRRWLRALITSGALALHESRYRLVNDTGENELEAAWARVEELRGDAGDTSELLRYFRTSTRALPELLRAEQDPVRLLFPEGRVDVSEAVYRDALIGRWTSAIVTATLARIATEQGGERLRVLEVGAGVGGASADAIAALGAFDVDYLFTDLSRFFLNAAQERFGDVPWLRFAVYDLDEDYRAQGLAPSSFDVVLAGDVLHATQDIGRVLAQLRELVVPGGWLVFVEMTREHYQVMTSLELMIRLDEATGDFLDERRGRDQTFLTRAQWLDAIEAAGGELVLCLPDPDHLMAELGMHVFAVRFKTDRASISSEGLGRHLAASLPDYMIPAEIQVVDRLPLTDNGKVDRKTLRSWLRRETGGGAVVGEEPQTELERRLAEVWSQVLVVETIGRDQTFFELGGDSLLAAQLTGRVREQVPEAAAIFFDDLLRRILEGPTIAALASALTREAEAVEEADAERPSPLVHRGGSGDGAALVLVHGADGTIGPLEELVPELTERARIVTLTVADAAAYLALDPSVLVERTAADYARLLLDDGLSHVHLVGAGFGGLLAAEVARQLAETGADVEGVTVVAAEPPPPDAAFAEQAARAAEAHELGAYAGDVTLVTPPDDASLELWQDVCLGELSVVDAPLGAGILAP